MKFMEAKRPAPPPPETVEEILAWWEDHAFDMPDWYMDGWEPSN